MIRLIALVSAAALLALTQSVVAQEGTPPLTKGPAALVEKSLRDISKGHVGAAIGDDVKALRRGPLLIHGNYCGIGNRPGAPPIDALDAACMRHDACTRAGKLPTCACDDRLRIEASEIARDPATPPDTQLVASATADAMAVLICKTGARPAAAVVVPVVPVAPPARSPAGADEAPR